MGVHAKHKGPSEGDGTYVESSPFFSPWFSGLFEPKITNSPHMLFITPGQKPDIYDEDRWFHYTFVFSFTIYH